MENGNDPLASNEHFDDVLLADFANTFYGYGDYNAPYWFVGMEEGGGDDFDEVRVRLSTWQKRGQRDLEDVAEFHLATGIDHFEKLFNKKPKLQKTWNKLIRILLSAKGQNVHREKVREYQRDSLGKISGGENCLIELLPLPSPSIQKWMYEKHSKLPQLASREKYKEYYMCRRAKYIRDLVDRHRPRVVVFYSTTKEFMEQWERIAGTTFSFDPVNKAFLARRDGTLFVIISHPGARKLGKEYFPNVERLITEELGK